MTGLPNGGLGATVTLDDGSGTFPYVITTFVRSWSLTFGRQDEASAIEASQLSMELDNNDGRFAYGSTLVGGPIVMDMPIQVAETVGGVTAVRFTGYVQNWPVQWANQTGTESRIGITATDRLARLARRTLRSVIENEIIAAGPSAYYTLSEATGATGAGDTSGFVSTVLTSVGSGTAVSFGTGVGLGTDGLTATVFAGGQYLGGSYARTLPVYSLSVFFRIATVPSLSGPAMWRVTTGGSPSTIDVNAGSGQLAFTIGGGVGLSSSGSVCDGLTHHAVLTYDGTTLTGYLDGTAIGTVTSAGVTLNATGLIAGQALTGTLSHAALFPTALTATQVNAIYTAGATGFAGNDSSFRIIKLAGYAGIPSAQVVGDPTVSASLTSVPAAVTSGETAASAIGDVEAAEGGSAFIGGDGRLVLYNRGHRVITATGAPGYAAQSDEYQHEDLVFTVDKQYLVNRVTGSRVGGASQMASNAASITLYDVYPGSLDGLLVSTDAQVADAASWQVANYSTVSARLAAVTFDLLTLPAATVQALLGLRIGDRLTLAGLPSQAPTPTADVLVEGGNEQQTTESWQITFNTVPAALFRAWVLGDATYGVLDSTTKLYY